MLGGWGLSKITLITRNQLEIYLKQRNRIQGVGNRTFFLYLHVDSSGEERWVWTSKWVDHPLKSHLTLNTSMQKCKHLVMCGLFSIKYMDLILSILSIPLWREVGMMMMMGIWFSPVRPWFELRDIRLFKTSRWTCFMIVLFIRTKELIT